MEKKLRIGIIGMGNAGMMHAKSLMEDMVPRASLTAVCDAADRAESLRKTLPSSVAIFDDYDKMVNSGACDAVIVATPHLMHPAQSEAALKAGLHVLCEKPLGVAVGPARKLIATAAKAGKVFAVNFPRRQEPVYQALAKLVKAGELGEIYRINWTITNFYRPDSYFKSASWRGTWAGEGGGVLINQCIHNLDIWQNLFGLPSRVRAFCGFGKHHGIEVEDDVTAYLEYADGKSGVIISSTSETPGVDRLEITCSRGRVLVEGRDITFFRTDMPIDEFNKKCESGFEEPAHWVCKIPVSGQVMSFSGMQRNFVDAVLDGTPLLVRGEEGLASLEIANAILLSTWSDDWASVPVDGKAFDAEMAARVKTSRKPSATPAGERKIFDLNKSFK